MNEPALEFTGERFTPECVREIRYEHWHRYAFARMFARGRRVLDAACGEGYGSALVADVAESVLGLDIDADAIAHARRRYGKQPNLRFDCADIAALDLAPGSVNLVVSFETLEHVDAQDALLASLARALADDGILLISSPDKAVYSDAAGFRNEFHVRELYRPELEALLARYFPHVRLYGQKLLFQSVLWPADGAAGGRAQSITADADANFADGLAYAPVYFIAVCSRQPLPDDLPALSLFGDREESVYAHYNHEIRKNMTAGARIAELEAQLTAVSAERDVLASRFASASQPWWRRLFGR